MRDLTVFMAFWWSPLKEILSSRNVLAKEKLQYTVKQQQQQQAWRSLKVASRRRLHWTQKDVTLYRSSVLVDSECPLMSDPQIQNTKSLKLFSSTVGLSGPARVTMTSIFCIQSL